MYFIDDMRINIGRTMGKGSQSDNLKLQADFYKFASKSALDRAWEKKCSYGDYEEGTLFVGETEEV